MSLFMCDVLLLQCLLCCGSGIAASQIAVLARTSSLLHDVRAELSRHSLLAARETEKDAEEQHMDALVAEVTLTCTAL